MATFTITGRMSAMTVKKSFKESSNSLTSPKYLPNQILFVFLQRKQFTHDRQSHDATDKTKCA